MRSTQKATLSVLSEHSETRLVCSGRWIIEELGDISAILENLIPDNQIVWDLAGVTEVDSAGAGLWHLYTRLFADQGVESRFERMNEAHEKLYTLLYSRTLDDTPPPKIPNIFYRIGRSSHQQMTGIGNFLAYLGEAFIQLFYLLSHPLQIRIRSIGVHILATGASALPIIGLSALLIGVVIAYQSIVQLQKFGADIFIVDTIGISLSRELAPLITAIIVAGRSGSAITAQIGAMKMTQEIDAMKTMGFDPFIFLVWPRVFALMLVMPLLIFFADIIGIFGGMIIANLHSHLSFTEFIHRLQGALALKHYVIGIIKGPFFAFLIALVSTYRGFQVSMNTESIGLYTTKSVVNSIFLVIACDAVFSILLTELKL